MSGVGFWMVVILDIEGNQYPDLASVPDGPPPSIAVVPRVPGGPEIVSREVLMVFNEYDPVVGDTPEFRLRQALGVVKTLNEAGFAIA